MLIVFRVLYPYKFFHSEIATGSPTLCALWSSTLA
jgi:hypothetical protein